MYIIFLGILGFLVLVSFFDRAIVSLAMLGLVVLVGLLIRKLGRLSVKIDTLEQRFEALRTRTQATAQANPDEAMTTAEPRAQAADGAATVSAQEPAPPSDDAAVPAPHEADAPAPVIDTPPAETGQPPPTTPTDSDTAPAVESDTPLPAAARAMSDPAASVQADSEWQDEATPSRPNAPPPPAARRHNWFDRMLTRTTTAAWSWITGGNVFVRVGIIILFMGMTFLIRYAIGQNLVPIELRLAIVGGIGIALLAWGWRQRERKAGFALVVQGGGIGLLYLTVFASFSLYRVLDSTVAFAMLGVIVLLAAILSIRQNARSLALFATVGGFLAPVLTSSGSNNYIGLFSYYTVLNLGVFAVAWYKSWRVLNLTGFVFTFVISGTWGVLSYQPEFYSTTQPFLVIFFLLYVGIAVLFALRRSLDFRDSIDSSLVFGTPLLAFAMQCELVGDFEYGIAQSAFVLAAFYLCAALLLWKRFGERLRLMCETFVSLAVIFATLAIPFAVDGSLTGSIWAIEGAGILWISIRQQQFYRRLFAVMLMLAAGVITAWEISVAEPLFFIGKQAFLNSAFIGAVLIAVAAATGSWLLSVPFTGRREIEQYIEYGLLGYSTLVLLAGYIVQVQAFALYQAEGHLLAALAVLGASAYLTAAIRLEWKMANWMALGYFVLLLPAAASSFMQQERLAENHGYLLWPVAFVALFFTLLRTHRLLPPWLSTGAHLAGAGLLAALLLWEGLWQLLLGYAVLSVVACRLALRFDWPDLRRCSILFLPVMALCFLLAAGYDGNLVELSSFASGYYPPWQPGGLLWPLAIATYFYLLGQNAGIGGRYQVYLYYGGAALVAAMLLWLGLWTLLLGATVLCWLAYYLAARRQWEEMRLLSKLLLPLMVLVPIAGLANGVVDPVRLIPLNLEFQLTPRAGFFLWPLAFVTLYLVYWLSEREQRPPSGLAHAASCLFLVALATWEISRLALALVPFSNGWHMALLPIVGLFAIFEILYAKRWPFDRYQQSFERYALLPLAAGSVLWSLAQFASPASAAPLLWIPLLNPVDLMQCLILYGWFRYGGDYLRGWFNLPAGYAVVILAVYLFAWINIDILRFVHHWTGVSWDLGRLLQADLTQTLMSLVWSVLGLAGTYLAARRQRRELWIAAAGLLAVVVLKLFAIDLSAQDTIERIVSFTGVGLLLLFVGYFSPIPPKHDAAAEASQ